MSTASPRMLLVATVALVAACATTGTDSARCTGFDACALDRRDVHDARARSGASDEPFAAIGDSIRVTDVRHPGGIGGTYPVDTAGAISVPQLGVVDVAGRTSSEIEALLLRGYGARFDLHVRVVPSRELYFVFGDVETEGMREFPGDLTVFEAVVQARPHEDTANLGQVRLIRSDPRDPFVQTVDLRDLIEKGDSTFNVHVQAGDVLFVPPIAPAAQDAPGEALPDVPPIARHVARTHEVRR